MTEKISTLPSFKLHLVKTLGSSRLRWIGERKVSEAFTRDSSPSKHDICVLIDALDDYDASPVIYGFGVVGSKSGVAAATVRVSLSPVHLLPAPVLISQLVASATSNELPEPYYAQPVDRKKAVELIDELSDHDGDLRRWLSEVAGPPRQFSPEVQQARAEARDAVALAAQFARIDLPEDAFSAQSPAKPNETLLDTVINGAYAHDLEEELLPLDLVRFDGKLVPHQRAASLTTFEDSSNENRLIVMSVNKKPLEVGLGIDLLYWDKRHDSFTFVQYKRLERVESTDGNFPHEWVYRRKAELVKQLALMPDGIETPASVEDWRAFGTPFWFKFVRGDAAQKLDDKALKGMYVPADWLRLAMNDKALLHTGKNRGFRVTYENTKYIGRTAFAEMVHRGFTGTGQGRTETFKKVLENHGMNRELIVAIRQAWKKDSRIHKVSPSPQIGHDGAEDEMDEAPF